MNSTVFWAIAIACGLLQLALCFFSRRKWLRILPMILLLALSGICAFLYFYSGSTNWAWLIILVWLLNMMVFVIYAWMVYGLYRLVKIVLKKRTVQRKNT